MRMMKNPLFLFWLVWALASVSVVVYGLADALSRRGWI